MIKSEKFKKDGRIEWEFGSHQTNTEKLITNISVKSLFVQ
jgi:hypothetical protein